MKNGSNGVAELEAAFADCGYVFRHYPDCTVPMMTWQCGRDVFDIVELPSGYGLMIKRFELLAWASTREQLIDKLA